jgi:hypothetical protein
MCAALCWPSASMKTSTSPRADPRPPLDGRAIAHRVGQSLPRKLLGFAALIAILVYFPGLAGSFIFDDAGVLTNNPAIRVDTLDLQSWLAAAGSFGGDGIHSRWLGMLTFAVNHYLAGMDPFWFKATNLAIHLCNGMLLFLSLNSLFDYASRLNKLSSSHSIFHRILAAAITSIWLILPINLTGVLYVSQRLETLSHTFVFLGSGGTCVPGLPTSKMGAGRAAFCFHLSSVRCLDCKSRSLRSFFRSLLFASNLPVVVFARIPGDGISQY